MNKVLLRSLLVFASVYVLLYLVVSLPAPKKAIASAYKQTANTVIPPFLSKAYLLFEQDPAMPNDPDRIRVKLNSQQIVDAQKQEAKAQGLKTINIRFKTYNLFLFEFFVFPMLFFAAFVIATPVPWKRKLTALLLGLGLLQVFMFFKTYFITLYHLQLNQIQEYQMSDFGQLVIEKTQLSFNNITTALITATLIWGITVFKKSDWKKLTTRLAKRTE